MQQRGNISIYMREFMQCIRSRSGVPGAPRIQRARKSSPVGFCWLHSLILDIHSLAHLFTQSSRIYGVLSLGNSAEQHRARPLRSLCSRSSKERNEHSWPGKGPSLWTELEGVGGGGPPGGRAPRRAQDALACVKA